MKTKIRTSDIYFVASLISLGHKIENVDKSDDRHMKFTVGSGPTLYKFESVNLPDAQAKSAELMGIEYYEELWANGQLMVNAVAFKHAFQHVQSVIHSS